MKLNNFKGIYFLSLLITLFFISCSDEESIGDTPSTDVVDDETPEPIMIQGVKASSFGYNAEDATDALQAALKSDNDTIIIVKGNEILIYKLFPESKTRWSW